MIPILPPDFNFYWTALWITVFLIVLGIGFIAYCYVKEALKEIKKEKLRCPFCGLEFDSVEELREHIQREH